MKRVILFSIVILVLCAGVADAWMMNKLRVNSETQLLGATIIRGFYNQIYAGTTRDALYVDYTGSGNYIFNFLADGASVMNLTKAGVLTFTGSFGDLTVAGADPSLIFNTTTAGDTDFWIGVQEDAGGTDNDTLEIGTGTTKGANTKWTLDKDGNLTLAGEIVHTNEDFIPVNDFNPEGDGANNDTVEHSRADPTNRRLFNRTTGVRDTQDMDWYGEKAVSQTPMSLTLWVRASDFANCVVTMTITDQGGAADATGAVVITPTGNDTWEEFTYTFTSTYTNDEELWIKIAITSLDTADTVDFSRCKIIY